MYVAKSIPGGLDAIVNNDEKSARGLVSRRVAYCSASGDWQYYGFGIVF
jgi:hypothetical protein